MANLLPRPGLPNQAGPRLEWLNRHHDLASIVISDFASAEFASAIARRVRTRDFDELKARTAFMNFDEWSRANAECMETRASDVSDAAGFLRRLDLTLRTPDALNIALCRRASAVLVTFDEKMASCATRLGIEIAPS